MCSYTGHTHSIWSPPVEPTHHGTLTFRQWHYGQNTRATQRA